MTQGATKVLTAHVPLPLADKIDQIATRLERSRGWIMKRKRPALPPAISDFTVLPT